MSKHTPGPFRYEPEDREVVTYLGNPLCEVFDTAEGLEGTDGDADANGTLFAAAPDLLAACKEGLRLGEIAVRAGLNFNQSETDKIIAKHIDLVAIRDAIAKAEGTS